MVKFQASEPSRWASTARNRRQGWADGYQVLWLVRGRELLNGEKTVGDKNLAVTSKLYPERGDRVTWYWEADVGTVRLSNIRTPGLAWLRRVVLTVACPELAGECSVSPGVLAQTHLPDHEDLSGVSFRTHGVRFPRKSARYPDGDGIVACIAGEAAGLDRRL